MPERMAAPIIREPALWDAGIRLMRVGDPDAWQAVTAAAEMRHDNREVIAACEQAAAKPRLNSVGGTRRERELLSI